MPYMPPQTGMPATQPGMPYMPPQTGMPAVQPGMPPQTGTTGPGPTNPMSPWNAIPQPPAPNNSPMVGGSQQPYAQPFDYRQVQEFSDAAFQDASRYLDPWLQQQRRGLNQNMINQGVDPASDRGRFMSEDLGRREADQMNSAMFQALGFGRDTQQQMFGQDAIRSQLADQMTMANMQNQLGYAGLDTSMYGMDLQHQLGLGHLGLGRQQQDFQEMMGIEGLRFQNDMFNEGNQRWDQGLIFRLAGLEPPNIRGDVNLSGGSMNPWAPYNEWWRNTTEGFPGGG
jgi:hypothetical protein